MLAFAKNAGGIKMGINFGTTDFATEWSETMPIQDIYCDGVAAVENLGATFRTVYFVWQRGPSGLVERVAVAKLVRPLGSLLSANGGIAAMIKATPLLGRTEVEKGH